MTFPMAGVALLPADALACSVCVGWTDGQGLNGGFYWSALLLTLLPFAVVAAIGAWAGYSARRGRSSRGRTGFRRETPGGRVSERRGVMT